jgi:hypothetical protein
MHCSYPTRAVESAVAVVTLSTPALHVFSQSLEGTYFENSEGAEGLVDYQEHFSVSQLETRDTHAYRGKPQLQDLPSKHL